MMVNKSLSRESVDENAKEALKQYAKDYAAAILHNARLIAYRDHALEVKRVHIEEAIETINKSKKRPWSRDLLITIGGALFGAFVQGFIQELSDGNTILIAVYVVLGFIGVLLVFQGLSR